jgi:hypothetical protein
LQKDANVELSGYCGYSADITGATAEAIIVNASIQVRAAGVSTGGDKGDGWVSYSSVRGVYIDNQQWYRHTLAIPPAMYAGKAGDQIRMVIVLKPANVDSREHTAPALVAPYGTLFSKSIKIVQM